MVAESRPMLAAICALNAVFVALWLLSLAAVTRDGSHMPLVAMAPFVPIAAANVVLDCLIARALWRRLSGQRHASEQREERGGVDVMVAPARLQLPGQHQ